MSQEPKDPVEYLGNSENWQSIGSIAEKLIKMNGGQK